MSLVAALFWGTLIVGGITFVAVAGALLVRPLGHGGGS